MEAYDPDIKDRSAPQNIVYSLVKHEQKEFLQIDNDGCLRLTKPLDRDQPLGFTRLDNARFKIYLCPAAARG